MSDLSRVEPEPERADTLRQALGPLQTAERP